VSGSEAAPRTRVGGGLLEVLIAILAVVAGAIHLTLGSAMFTLNAIGYFGLAALLLIATFVDHPLVVRFGWLPRAGLGAYALGSIFAWFMMGGRYDLAYFTKALELVIIGLLAVDVWLVYGGPMGFVRAALASVRRTAPGT
jgi:hypothetical protein